MAHRTQPAPVPTTEWDPALQDILRAMRNRPLNVHKLLANSPALLAAWWPLRQYVVSGGELGKRNAEIVILRTAYHLRNVYEWASHVERGQAAGLTLLEIDSLGTTALAGLADRDSLLALAVDDLVEHRKLGPDTLAALAEHFSHQQLMDVIAVHSTYTMLGCMLNSWPVDLDEHVVAALPEGAREPW